MALRELEFQVGPGGWIEAVETFPDGDFASFYVRLSRRGDGGWVLQGTVYLPGLGAETLRRLPLNRIMLAVAASTSLRADIQARLDDAVPEIGSAEFAAAFAGFVHSEPLELERPRGRNLPVEFYTKVAETYRAAASRGLQPRTAIAAAAGVSGEVAGRWVREARRRGLLPPTSPGKVSA